MRYATEQLSAKSGLHAAVVRENAEQGTQRPYGDVWAVVDTQAHPKRAVAWAMEADAKAIALDMNQMDLARI